MTKDEKRLIAERLKTYCDQKGSQNKAARSMNGVSSATISKILSCDWETISDEMWRAVAAQAGHDNQQWKIVKTRTFERMIFLLNETKANALTLAVTGFAGCGKTEAIKHYTAANRNVYHLMCSEYWNRRTFIQKLLKTLGEDMAGSVSEQMDVIIDTLKRADAPLLVFDEADKLSDQVLYFFISIYNQLEGHCGIILCATDYLQKRIERGLRFKKKGYEEIYSRIGRRFVQLQVVNSEDIAAVCMANGVCDASDINKIANDSDSDMRRVKRAVWSMQMEGAR